MITLTDTARDKVLEFIKNEEKKGWAIRLAVEDMSVGRPACANAVSNIQQPHGKESEQPFSRSGIFTLHQRIAYQILQVFEATQRLYVSQHAFTDVLAQCPISLKLGLGEELV